MTIGFHDGTCLACGSETHAIDPAPPNVRGEDGDYCIACDNPECVNSCGELVYDTECPPKWATHSKTPLEFVQDIAQQRDVIVALHEQVKYERERIR